MPRSRPPASRPRAAAPSPRAPAEDGAALARRLGLDRAPPWAAYVQRGYRECAFQQVKLVGRVVGAIYDEALKPVGLRASQLALLWAILAMEPVDFSSLGAATQTDATTLSRTVQNLRRAGLVGVSAGEDRRVKVLRLTAAGRSRFAAAMPHWERAQRDAARILSLETVQALGRQVRRAMREAA